MKLRRMFVKWTWRQSGFSWGLDWPLMFRDIGFGWVVYERDGGLVKQFFPQEPNVHGYSNAQYLAQKASSPPHDPAINAAQDMVS